MRQRVALEAAKKLRPDFVAGGKEEQIEKDGLDECGDFDVELSDQYTCEKSSNNGPQAKAADLNASDGKANGERKEDGQFRILL